MIHSSGAVNSKNVIRSARWVLSVVTTHSDCAVLTRFLVHSFNLVVSYVLIRTSHAVLLLSRGSIKSSGTLSGDDSFVASGVLRGVDSFIGNGALVLPDSFCARRFSRTP